MEYDYSKLIGKIVEKFRTRAAFAEKIGLSEKSLSSKLTNHSAFKQSEIERAVCLLDLDKSEIANYFFTLKVQSA